MKMKTNELTDAALDRAVAKCEGKPSWMMGFSTEWEKGGPIIEREKISIEYMAGAGDAGADVWVATMTFPDKKFGAVSFSEEQGSTALIAAMRCYVASKLGNEVDVPDEFRTVRKGDV